MLAASLFLAACVSASAEDSPSILEIAATLPTLNAAIEAADLDGALAGSGPFTVFAPSEAAFAALPDGLLESLLDPANRGALAAILKHHVVASEVSAASALVEGSLTTLAGTSLSIVLGKGRIRVAEAGVLTNDVRASNGVIHIIDQVLIPPENAASSDVDPATRLIASAIERGAPFFNAGQPAACAAVYETATIALVTLDGAAPNAAVAALNRALDNARRTSDATERAWALRDGLDRALEILAGGERAALLAPATSTVFEFAGDGPRWFPVNDDVMGGISRCRYTPTSKGTALFEGALSLENNGGFATIRSPAADLGLDDADGVVLRVRGDGRTYTFSALKRDARNEINLWRVDFDTVAGEWLDVRLSFEALTHSVMGFRVPNAPDLDPATIRSFAIGIADKDTTPFRLEIDSITSFRDGV